MVSRTSFSQTFVLLSFVLGFVSLFALALVQTLLSTPTLVDVPNEYIQAVPELYRARIITIALLVISWINALYVFQFFRVADRKRRACGISVLLGTTSFILATINFFVRDDLGRPPTLARLARDTLSLPPFEPPDIGPYESGSWDYNVVSFCQRSQDERYRSFLVSTISTGIQMFSLAVGLCPSKRPELLRDWVDPSSHKISGPGQTAGHTHELQDVQHLGSHHRQQLAAAFSRQEVGRSSNIKFLQDVSYCYNSSLFYV